MVVYQAHTHYFVCVCVFRIAAGGGSKETRKTKKKKTFLFGFISSPPLFILHLIQELEARYILSITILFDWTWEMNHGRRAFLICNQIDKQERKSKQEEGKKKTIKEILKKQT